MLRKVYLHGDLARLHDGPIVVAAETAAEAVEAVTRQIPGFKPAFNRPPKKVKVVGCEKVEDLFVPLDQDELHLVPQLNGGKKGGWVQILIGIALVAISFIPGLQAFATLASILLKAGALLILGGLVQLLSPKPSSDDERQRSDYLGAPGNTVRIGTRIPILYGRYRVYGHYLSFDIHATRVAAEV